MRTVPFCRVRRLLYRFCHFCGSKFCVLPEREQGQTCLDKRGAEHRHVSHVRDSKSILSSFEPARPTLEMGLCIVVTRLIRFSHARFIKHRDGSVRILCMTCSLHIRNCSRHGHLILLSCWTESSDDAANIDSSIELLTMNHCQR